LNAFTLSIAALGVAMAVAGGYLALTPADELIKGGGPTFKANALDQKFPAWRRLIGGAVLLVSFGLIATSVGVALV
jgi:hypothetical protein